MQRINKKQMKRFQLKSLFQRFRFFLLLGGMILFVWTFSSCERHTPSGVLKRSQMTEVLVDYHLARAMSASLSPADRYKAPLYEEGVYRKNGITKEAFEASMEWYTRNPEDLAIIYARVNSQLQVRMDEYKDKKSESDANISSGAQTPLSSTFPSGDTVDVWNGKRLIHASRLNSSLSNLTVLNTPDSTFHIHDVMEWKLRATFLPEQKVNNISGKAVLFLSVRYGSPDTILVNTRIIRQSGDYKLRVVCKQPLSIHEVKTYIQYFPLRENNHLFIDRIQLMRYHRP